MDKISKLRKDAIKIFNAGLYEVRAKNVIKECVKINNNKLIIKNKAFDLNKFKRIFVIGAGKATAQMALALEKILRHRIFKGFIIVKHGHSEKLNKIKVLNAGHPIPDENSIKGANIIMDLLKETKKDDLIINLISGGGSSLLCAPIPPISLDHKIKLTNILLKCGANIAEINTIRKHISLIKGGRLAEYAHPSTLISLIISDVCGDPLDIISSGPTVYDSSTYFDAFKIIKKYKIINKIPKAILDYLQDGIASKRPETPKKNNKIFDEVYNFIIANNKKAIKACKIRALKLNYKNIFILGDNLQGDVRILANKHYNFLTQKLKKKSKFCVISGGEATVKIKGKGLGGRNQEFALHLVKKIASLNNIVVLSIGTDGTDGPTDAAGAICDTTSLTRANKLNLDINNYLNNNDSYNFFKKLDDLIITGPTGTNVMDLRIIICDL
jgi:glycerate-2-kinase